jgi:hypothetical protein
MSGAAYLMFRSQCGCRCCCRYRLCSCEIGRDVSSTNTVTIHLFDILTVANIGRSNQVKALEAAVDELRASSREGPSKHLYSYNIMACQPFKVSLDCETSGP